MEGTRGNISQQIRNPPARQRTAYKAIFEQLHRQNSSCSFCFSIFRRQDEITRCYKDKTRRINKTYTNDQSDASQIAKISSCILFVGLAHQFKNAFWLCHFRPSPQVILHHSGKDRRLWPRQSPTGHPNNREKSDMQTEGHPKSLEQTLIRPQEVLDCFSNFEN